jgi:DNA-binding Lrp family transcriptional regulator
LRGEDRRGLVGRRGGGIGFETCPAFYAVSGDRRETLLSLDDHLGWRTEWGAEKLFWHEFCQILCCALLKRVSRQEGSTMKLDRIDIKILHELQKNGRVTNVELAELVSLSPSPCLIRVKKLQAEGYIEGYSAQISMTKLGQTLTVFTEVTLKNHRQIDFARFLAAVDKIDQLIECHLVSGGYDYMMKFVTAGIGEYQAIMERLTDMDIGIDKYFSYVVLKSPIVRSHMPLTSLFPL